MHTESHGDVFMAQGRWFAAANMKHVAKVLLLISFLGLCFTTVAQRQERIDSLKALLPGRTDQERADVFYHLADEYADFDYTLLAKYIEQSFQYAKRAGDSLRIVRAGRIKAAAFRRLGELDSALMLGFEMLPIATRNAYGKEVSKILRGIAIGYTFKADYALGLQYNFELLKITEAENDSIEMSYVLNNIGLVYFKLTDNEKALQYFGRSLKMKPLLDDYPSTSTFLNMSLCYSILRNFSRAREYIKKGLSSCQPECQGAFMIEGLQSYGRLYLYKDDLDSAETYYLKSYALARALDDKRYQLIAVCYLEDIYLQRNQVSLAALYLAEAESIMEESPFAYELIDLYSRLFSLHKKTGNKRKMAFYQEQYIELKDNIYNEVLTNNLMKIESDYLERANKARITAQEQLLVLKDQVIRWQNALNVLIGIITILLVSLLYILYRSNRQRKSANQLLDLKVKERTAALESSHLALKQSLEEEDRTVADAFMDLKNPIAAIKELCSLGLAAEDVPDVENRKYLQEIFTVTAQISLILNNIYGDNKGT
jgi:tetratricopeptide (TPR) repeat protein